MSSSKLRSFDREAIATYVIGLVAWTAGSAVLAGMIYDSNSHMDKDCISRDGQQYCTVGVKIHELVYLEVFGWTALVVLAAWTICYGAHRYARWS